MRTARQGDVLQTTALIHEAYIRLIDVNRVRWQNRAHFFAVSAKLMRQVLVDAVRTSGARKRGGGSPACRVRRGPRAGTRARNGRWSPSTRPSTRSRRSIARKSQVVELRYFGGLSVEETAEVLKVSEQTVTRDWRMAKLWLARELGRGHVTRLR